LGSGFLNGEGTQQAHSYTQMQDKARCLHRHGMVSSLVNPAPAQDLQISSKEQ
jgi:hypothetical protein